MKKIFIFLIASLLFTPCYSSSKMIGKKSVALLPIAIPFRDNAYSKVPSKLITSKSELNGFLAQVAHTANWDTKAEFLEKIKKANINFKRFNLLFYRITESSGSSKVKVYNNKISLTNGTITIPIKRENAAIGTADMAYYALAYKLSKDIVKKVIFNDTKQKVVVANKRSAMVIPLNCKVWFDGCNNCAKSRGCTRKYCIAHRPEKFKCLEWIK